MVRHRKDVDGVYDMTAQSMAGYHYDPYGAPIQAGPSPAAPSSSPLYSLDDNPWQYTNEFRDPISRAYYLRARWYLPSHQTFPQRDPTPNLNRYGYTGGNPVARIDPSGQNWEKFDEREKGFQRFVGRLEGGRWSTLGDTVGAGADGGRPARETQVLLAKLARMDVRPCNRIGLDDRHRI